jgi:hypothetical protein
MGYISSERRKRRIVMDEFRTYSRKSLQRNLRYCPSICLERMRSPTKNSQDKQHLG